MRRPRCLVPPEFGVGYYHLVSRILEKRYLLCEQEKKDFLRLMRVYERLCQVRVLSYCLMDNHFHLLVEVPNRPEVLPSEQEVLRLIADSLGPQRALEQRLIWRDWREADTGKVGFGEERVQQDLARWHERMWNVSAFMKILKQRFTQWYNKRHARKGTLWEDRFKSTLVQGGGALGTVGAYIDLNPIRADMVPDPKDYGWSSYGAAEAGCKLAQAGLQRLTMLAMDDPATHNNTETAGAPIGDVSGPEVPQRYREKLLLVGVESGVKEDGTPVRKGMSQKTSEQKLRELEGAKEKVKRQKMPSRPPMSKGELLRCRVRQFSAGMAVGTREFVESIFEFHRRSFGSGRKTGARRVPGTKKDAGLFALRNLGRPMETYAGEDSTVE